MQGFIIDVIQSLAIIYFAGAVIATRRTLRQILNLTLDDFK